MGILSMSLTTLAPEMLGVPGRFNQKKTKFGVKCMIFAVAKMNGESDDDIRYL